MYTAGSLPAATSAVQFPYTRFFKTYKLMQTANNYLNHLSLFSSGIWFLCPSERATAAKEPTIFSAKAK